MSTTSTDLLSSGTFDGTAYTLRANVTPGGEAFCTLYVREGEVEYTGTYYSPEGMLTTFRAALAGDFHVPELHGLDDWTRQRMEYVASLAYRASLR